MLIDRLLADDTAGDPMTGLRWTRRTTAKIADLLATEGFEISPNTVARLLHDMDYSLRVNRKAIATTHSPDRNAQFEYIADLRQRFQRQHWPIISVDSKKRELVGLFKNPGARWAREARPIYDHDFRTDARGVGIPYGISDPWPIAAPSSLGFRTIRPPSPLRRSPIGGAMKDGPPIGGRTASLSWPIPVGAMGLAVRRGKRNCSHT